MTPQSVNPIARMTGRDATNHGEWRPGVRFTVRKRTYEVARNGGTVAATWTSCFCWRIDEDGRAKPGEREIQVPDTAKVAILRWGKPAWLSWEEWADRGYQNPPG